MRQDKVTTPYIYANIYHNFVQIIIPTLKNRTTEVIWICCNLRQTGSLKRELPYRIHVLTISVLVLILPIFCQLLLRKGKVSSKCFQTSEHSVLTANDNSKITSKAFSTTFLLCSFKLVLYLDTTGISNQVKYYLTNRGNFMDNAVWLLQLCFAFYCERLAVERAFTKNSRKAVTWLFGASPWIIIIALRLSSSQVSSFLLTGEAGIANVQGCGIHWYLSWLAS